MGGRGYICSVFLYVTHCVCFLFGEIDKTSLFASVWYERVQFRVSVGEPHCATYFLLYFATSHNMGKLLVSYNIKISSTTCICIRKKSVWFTTNVSTLLSGFSRAKYITFHHQPSFLLPSCTPDRKKRRAQQYCR